MAWLQRRFPTFLRTPDFNSIRFRLTAGVVIASAVGISGIAGWLSWRMHQAFLTGHEEAILTLSQEFEEDVKLYEDMMTTQEAVQKVIDLRAMGDTAIWVTTENGTFAASETLSMGSWQESGLTSYLQALPTHNRLEVVSVNDRFLAICIGPLEINGSPLGTLFIVEDISQNQKTYRTMTRSLVIISSSTVLLLAGLIALYVQRSLQPIKSLSTEVMGVTADSLTATRLELDKAPTEVKELARALDHTLERLAQSWEQQRRLVGDVSHELRTPLTLVQGYLQSTLRRCQTLTAPQRDGLETAASETDRTIQILNDLLVLARASMGHLHLSGERLDLKSVVLEAVAMADTTGDRVEADIKNAPIWVRADASAMRQVLVNLIDNALNYSSPEEKVTVSLFQQDKQAWVKVHDRGRGIPLADQSEIFEPFYRVDVDRCRMTGGTGLGLAIVKSLLGQMQGSISVQSKLGEGSTFTVKLPICQGA
ncbi:HAMP domain-containing sensor histidine kinase [Oscillatoria sp. CS-180]|uniref:sensor histidine kinase n=1 Tax=Oscillatoria sp. CS-180 TaxID=3021720 RepID=UPI00232E8B15|nr:HAMP domain-containing sensor histidine kinase [Oscillatoria sp. CS-180]MDB9527012.1 HAMP domain-containing sensor histidine kinase [Oscillatoria sp. CS-180]